MAMDWQRTAVIPIDLQNDWVNLIVKGDSVERAARVLDAARQAGVSVLHVRVAHQPGHPAVGPIANHHEAGMKGRGGGVDGEPGAQIVPKLVPQDGEPVITKQHSAPFVGTWLEQALRTRDIRTIVVMGVATSGAVKNIVTDGINRDFDVIVLSDCCEDMHPNIHSVLVEKVFPQVCDVMTSDRFLAALSDQG